MVDLYVLTWKEVQDYKVKKSFGKQYHIPIQKNKAMIENS